MLTNGPGNRGFDFNGDSDFINANMESPMGTISRIWVSDISLPGSGCSYLWLHSFR